MRALYADAHDVIDYLIPHEAGFISPLFDSAIFVAIKRQNLRALKALASHEYDFHDLEGNTPLWAAVKYVWPDGVEALACYYATLESVIDLATGETPLIYAI